MSIVCALLNGCSHLLHSRCRSHPQENRWVTKLLRAYNNTTLGAVSAGGWHVLALTTGNKQVVSWGAGDYGQLGNGFMWDDSQPKVVNEIMVRSLRLAPPTRCFLTRCLLCLPFYAPTRPVAALAMCPARTCLP